MRRGSLITKATAAGVFLASAVLFLPPAGTLNAAPPPTVFQGLNPARLADTRPSGQTVDGNVRNTGPLGPGGTLVVPVEGRGGVPSVGATAVALNVTAINPTAASFLTVYPSGVNRPNASNLNLAPGRTLPNMVIVPLGDDGSVTVYNDRGTTNVAVDVLGWFPILAFEGLVPARLADTRASGQTVDGNVRDTGPLAAGATLSVPVAGRGGVPAAGAGAVALNVTAINPSAASFLTVYPKGATRPNASNLNLAPGRTLPNMVIVPLGDDGSVTVYNDRGSTNVAVDVLGWFPEFNTFTGLTPARFLDTRTSGVTVDEDFQADGPLGEGATLTLKITGRGDVPGTKVSGIALNVTAINPSAPSFLTIYPAGANRPNASNLNLAPGRTLPNMVIVPLPESGEISIYNDRGQTHVAVDVLGWFPHDVEAPSTVRRSVPGFDGQANGPSFRSSISADGRFVAFDSTATDLVGSDTNNASDVFVHDRQTGSITRVSVSTGGIQASGPSSNPSISADGRYIAFESSATDLVANDTNLALDVFLHDRVTGVTTLVSVGNGGILGNGGSSDPSISANGRYITFQSIASNLAANDTNSLTDIFVRDRIAGTTERVSVSSSDGQSNGSSSHPTISADGRYVAFESGAANLVGVGADTNGAYDIFLRDRVDKTTTLISRSSDGVQGSANSSIPSISANGRYIAFESLSDNLVAGDTNGHWDVFVHDRITGSTIRASLAHDGGQAPSTTGEVAISADGRFVAFESSGPLVPEDTNGAADVYVRDLAMGTTLRVSVATGGAQIPNGTFALSPSISADGRYIAFESTANNLIPVDTNGQRDVFVRNQGAVMAVLG